MMIAVEFQYLLLPTALTMFATHCGPVVASGTPSVGGQPSVRVGQAAFPELGVGAHDGTGGSSLPHRVSPQALVFKGDFTARYRELADDREQLGGLVEGQVDEEAFDQPRRRFG